MNISTSVWVELVPVYGFEWDTKPSALKAGKVLKKAPSQADRHRFVRVNITVDNLRYALVSDVDLP